MSENRRPRRRGRPAKSRGKTAPETTSAEPDPYLDSSAPESASDGPPPELRTPEPRAAADEAPPAAPNAEPSSGSAPAEAGSAEGNGGASSAPMNGANGGGRPQFEHRRERFGRRGRRHRGRNRGNGGEQNGQGGGPPAQPIVADGDTVGWFDPSRDAGFIRRAGASYLEEQGDAYVPAYLARQHGLRKSDLVRATTGRDHRGRPTCVEILSINEHDPADALRRPDFASLTASYPDRRLTLETGRPARVGPELTRRAIDLIAPIGYGQRALIVAPARAGKTMLLQAITEGVALKHPDATLLILLVDERPEEVSEAISWGVGEVIASSFDQPARRHVEVTEMVLERARRLVELGKDVVIVLDSLTRMARAHNTAERGTGRTMSGGLDTSAMAKPKAFFGSARNIAPENGGGSLTIIATALVETGSRMDDVIFEEFKGTGNCEIKLDRGLSEKRIFPAFDIASSGTRREEKLYKPGQLDAIYALRRGLQQMPPQAGMEWMIKRIASTPDNDTLLGGLV
ncbi:MAG: transcription termination factor Rho [Gemmatimonadetes bacterium]|nr:transcription termination factor Rho [Gemmatimonadota bacterium]